MTSPNMMPPPLEAGDAVFLDFDGTLAPIQEDPDTVYLPDGMADLLQELNRGQSGAVAIISGRDLDDLSKRVPASLWRFGNHGLRSAAPGEVAPPVAAEAPAGLVQDISRFIAPLAGVRLEPKGPVLAIHFREAPDAEGHLLDGLAGIAAAADDYTLQKGKCVLEVKPRNANKGACLRAASAGAPFAGRRPVMIGDDTTDEDAFAVALELNGLAIKVGEGESIAPYRLGAPADVHAYLRERAHS